MFWMTFCHVCEAFLESHLEEPASSHKTIEKAAVETWRRIWCPLHSPESGFPAFWRDAQSKIQVLYAILAQSDPVIRHNWCVPQLRAATPQWHPCKKCCFVGAVNGTPVENSTKWIVSSISMLLSCASLHPPALEPGIGSWNTQTRNCCGFGHHIIIVPKWKLAQAFPNRKCHFSSFWEIFQGVSKKEQTKFGLHFVNRKTERGPQQENSKFSPIFSDISDAHLDKSRWFPRKPVSRASQTTEPIEKWGKKQTNRNAPCEQAHKVKIQEHFPHPKNQQTLAFRHEERHTWKHQLYQLKSEAHWTFRVSGTEWQGGSCQGKLLWSEQCLEKWRKEKGTSKEAATLTIRNTEQVQAHTCQR